MHTWMMYDEQTKFELKKQLQGGLAPLAQSWSITVKVAK
jgi:hypothetical protein